MPFIPGYSLRLSLTAVRAKLADFRNGFSAIQAELGFRTHGGARDGRTAFGRTGRASLLEGIHHGLAHGDSSAEPCADSRRSAALVCGSHWNRLRQLVRGIPAHVPDHIHANALVENLLQFIR